MTTPEESRRQHPAGTGRWTERDDAQLHAFIRGTHAPGAAADWDQHVSEALEVAASGRPQVSGPQEATSAWGAREEAIRRTFWIVVLVTSVPLIVADLLSPHL